jgi:TnpA family transposase
MTSIERTAYPRLKRRPSSQELADVYTPTVEDLAFIRSTARGASSTLTLAVLLKVFQRLGHVPRLQDVPFGIVAHVRSSLRLQSDTALDVTPRTLYRHHEQIRTQLQVKSWGAEARRATIVAVHQAAQVMDHPADLINVAIEDLVRQRFELPAFSTLDSLATHVRAVVHRRLFATVLDRLSEQQRQQLDALLESDQLGRSAFNALKRAPKRPSLSHLVDLVGHVRWLEELREPAELMAGVPPAKVRHFAAEARSLDAAEVRDITAPKRYTLLLSLISRAQVQGRDDLAEMFGKRMALFETRAKEELALIRERQRETTEMLVGAFADVLQVLDGDPSDAETGPLVKQVVAQHGDIRQLLASCEAIAAYNGDNYYPLMWRFYRSHRSTLFRLAHTLRFISTTRDTSVMQALEVVLANEDRTGDYLPAGVNLSFASEQWLRTVLVQTDKGLRLARRHFEVCTFAALAAALKAGDVAVEGSDAYADYREQLLPWSECEPQVVDYCQAVELPATAAGFVKHLQELLATTAKRVDAALPSSGHVVINDKGEPVIKRGLRRQPSASAQALEAALVERMPERNILDMLANVSSWTQCFRHLGPLSGSEPKLADPVQRYILTVFAYGCNLGPTEAARHMQGLASAHELSFTNRRHVSVAQLEAAIKDLVNAYHRCDLPKVWGTGSSAAADGTKYELAENSLLAEYSIRYGGYGGIAYHHVSDTYIALFSHFIPCGVWEAIYILEGLLKNTSDIQPTTVHADTQGQSTPVHALAFLLGIKLMPRIRNWKDLTFFRPSKDAKYRHIDGLFSDTVDWQLIQDHWPDLLQVALSIKAGTILSAQLLRRLGSYSRRNRLYQAFRELGRVVRTIFLLEFLNDAKLREQITATTNKVEAYNGFAKWLNFGGEGVIDTIDPVEQEKHLKYNHVVANAAAIQNVIDLTRAVRDLQAEGYFVRREDLAQLSPYQTRRLKRFGDYTLSMSSPEPFDTDLVVPFPLEDAQESAATA